MHIKKAEFIKSSPDQKDCPPENIPEYAFIGRSNVGKSSLINMITNRNNLAKTSGKPGKTQLINHFEIDESWYLVDLPGYGWAQVSKKDKANWKKMTHKYLEKRKNLINIFLLVDSRHEPQKVDLEFMRYLGENGLPFSIVFTKADKQGKTKTQSNVSFYKKILKKEWEFLPPIFVTSATSNMGKEEILKYIDELNKTVDI